MHYIYIDGGQDHEELTRPEVRPYVVRDYLLPTAHPPTPAFVIGVPVTHAGDGWTVRQYMVTHYCILRYLWTCEFLAVLAVVYYAVPRCFGVIGIVVSHSPHLAV